jgi:hypothetical protein
MIDFGGQTRESNVNITRTEKTCKKNEQEQWVKSNLSESKNCSEVKDRHGCNGYI